MRLLVRNAALRSQISQHSFRCFSTTTSVWRGGPNSKKRKDLEPDLMPRLLAAKRFQARRLRVNDDVAASSRAESISQGHDPNTRLRFSPTLKLSKRLALFRSTVLARLNYVINSPKGPRFASIEQDELHRHACFFMDKIDYAFALADKGITQPEKNRLFWELRDAFISRDIKGLTAKIQYSLHSFMVKGEVSEELKQSQKRMLDLQYPHEWFPATRMMQRTIHVHVGPTNSGKTYNALKALENSKRGVYAGPLRLLATEVYQRLNAKGLPCALITGEEVRLPDDVDQYFTSCTVEMVPLNKQFDVAVIDEIQMIADVERGSAWTTAVLGVQAKEVHVCGEERAVKLIQQLCASVGDNCVIHRYERLNPLKTMDRAIGKDYKNLQKGDCIVAFSRVNLHALKKNIEEKTGRRCAIVYGSLPPEVRVQQAALFNDSNNDYDFIVASDAIGMGLNLEIRRIIMDAVSKFDGNQNRLLTFPEIKQIGGRAGRYRSASNSAVSSEEDKVGYVTTMEQADLKSVQRAFTKRVDDLEKAVIQPPAGIVERFSSYHPPTMPLSFILMKIEAEAKVSELYRLNIGADHLEIADIIQDLPLTIHDRLTFCYLPASLRAEGSIDVLRALARVVSTSSNGDLLDIKEIPLEFLDLKLEDFPDGHMYLQKLESLHVAINQYVWLSYRYAGMFRSQALAFHVRSLVEEKLIETLDRLNFSEEHLERRRKLQRIRAKSHELHKMFDEDGEDDDDAGHHHHHQKQHRQSEDAVVAEAR